MRITFDHDITATEARTILHDVLLPAEMKTAVITANVCCFDTKRAAGQIALGLGRVNFVYFAVGEE